MTKGFDKQSMINAGDLDLQHIFCPECENDSNLRLIGYAMVPREETISGEYMTVETDKDKAAFDLRRLDCLDCKTSFIIVDKHLFESQQTVTFLATYIQKLTGQNLLETGTVH